VRFGWGGRGCSSLTPGLCRRRASARGLPRREKAAAAAACRAAGPAHDEGCGDRNTPRAGEGEVLPVKELQRSGSCNAHVLAMQPLRAAAGPPAKVDALRRQHGRRQAPPNRRPTPRPSHAGPAPFRVKASVPAPARAPAPSFARFTPAGGPRRPSGPGGAIRRRAWSFARGGGEENLGRSAEPDRP
jgi:hypothetical protein